MRTRLAFILLAAGGPTWATALTEKSMWSLERIAPPAISPDGKTAVAAVTRFDIKEDKSIADLWWFATDGSEERLLTQAASNESAPAFSPDGKWLSFIAQRDDDKSPQVYAMPLSGGEARRVTSIPTGVSVAKWHGDSQRMVVLTRVWPGVSWTDSAARIKERTESKMTAKVWDDTPVMYWDQFIDDRQAHLFEIALSGGEPKPLTLASKLELPRSLSDASSFDVNRKTGAVAFVADSNPDHNKINLDVFLLGADGSASNLTTDNVGSDNVPLWSPDGKKLAYVRQTIVGFYGDTRRLRIYDTASQNTQTLHTDWDRSADNLIWKADSAGLLGAIDDAGTVRAYELPLKGKPRRITDGSNIGALALAANGKTLVALRESYIEPPTLVRLDMRSGQSTILGTRNKEALDAIEFGTYESVTYTGANGVPIQMWVNYPPGFDKSRRYPVFLLLHGGPHNGITNAFSFRWNAQVFAARGYVTAWHNFHGSSGFGQAFTDSINPNQDILPYEDTIKAAEWLAAQPFVDKDRMVAGGGSYGGYLASILLGREHPFKALIAHAAVYNWYTQIGSDFGFSDARFPEFWEDPTIFQRSSPHLGAGNFKTPTLVIHGQLDYRVPVNHGFELYQTLKKRDVPTRLIYYPNENHWILKPQNSIFWYEEVHHWIEKYAPPGAK